MALFSKKSEQASVALLDITSSSVGGALVLVAHGSLPTVYYTHRLPIESHEGEDLTSAMLRALDELAATLIRQGAPILRQETKSGRIERVYVSIGAPWQATSVRTQHVNESKPFTFTHAFLTEITRKSSVVREGYRLSGESVIATMLNGYEVQHPFGKKVTRAELIILSSLIEKNAAESIEEVLRKTYHTHALTLTAFAPLAYMVFRDIFPHEKDFLVLDVSGKATDIAFVKRGLLVDVASLPHGTTELVHKGQSPVTGNDILPSDRLTKEMDSSRKEWLDALTSTLREFSTKNALPRTLFLLAEDASREYLKSLLDSPELRSLWLTDEPLAVIPVLPSQFSSFVRSRGEAGGDVYLSLLAMFANRQQGSA
ncbi:MAG: hypothetical protein P4M11_01580 [Candidatus Pacebacteria bacterium]|nr:hypothetical protein [Candidatus Paceibacterota bacterium]